MDQARGFTVSQFLVRRKAYTVAELHVRSHFSASLRSGPDLGGTDQISPDPLPAIGLIHEPAFQVPDVLCLTVFDKGTNTYLEETSQVPVLTFRDKDLFGIGMTKNIKHLVLMV